MLTSGSFDDTVHSDSDAYLASHESDPVAWDDGIVEKGRGHDMRLYQIRDKNV
jgi:hypothetical protein